MFVYVLPKVCRTQLTALIGVCSTDTYSLLIANQTQQWRPLYGQCSIDTTTSTPRVGTT